MEIIKFYKKIVTMVFFFICFCFTTCMAAQNPTKFTVNAGEKQITLPKTKYIGITIYGPCSKQLLIALAKKIRENAISEVDIVIRKKNSIGVNITDLRLFIDELRKLKIEIHSVNFWVPKEGKIHQEN